MLVADSGRDAPPSYLPCQQDDGVMVTCYSQRAGVLCYRRYCLDRGTLLKRGGSVTSHMHLPINFDHPRAQLLKRNQYSYGDWFHCARWSPDQRFIASCCTGYNDDSAVDVWDATTGSVIASQTIPHRAITTLAWSPGSKTIAYCMADGAIHLWNPFAQKIPATVHVHHRQVSTLEWSAAGDTILTSGEDATLLWNSHTGRIMQRFQTASGEGRLAAALRANAEHIALGAPGEPLRVVNLATGKTEAVLVAHLTFLPLLRWSPSGTHLLYTSEETVLRVWTVSSQKNSAYIQTEQPVSDVAWSSDEQTCGAITSGDGSFPELCHLYLWNRRTSETLFHREIRRVYALYAIDFAPDGQALVVAGAQSLLAIWDLDGSHFPALWAGVPSPERREELAIWAELNAERDHPPYYEVRLHSRQEVEWIFQEHDWFSRHVEKPGTGAHPHSAQFAGADMHDLDLSGMSFNTSDFSDADLRGANLTSCEFEGANLSHARLDGATVVDTAFSYAKLDYINFSGITFKDTRFYETWVINAIFVGCRFEEANFGSADFWLCDFSQADFSGADLRSAHFSECMFLGANFSQADLSQATFERCTVDTPDIFARAITSERTKINDLIVSSS